MIKQKISNINHLISLISFLLTIKFAFILTQINDNFKTYTLSGEDGYDLLDIVDYNNLNLFITTSKNIYQGIPPMKKSETQANLKSVSSLATINENYLLACCLSDSLLTKININTGESSSLLLYNNIATSTTLTLPEDICSISIFENIVFIGYTQTEGSNKINLVIRIYIKNKDDEEGPILDSSFEIKFFIFPNQNSQTVSTRQVGCEAVYITNNKLNYRLICSYESNSSGKYVIYSFAIKNNFEEIEGNDQIHQLYSVSSVSGLRLYKIDPYHVRCIMRKMVYDLYLEQNNELVNTIPIKQDSNLTSYSATRYLFDHNNNFVISSEVYKKISWVKTNFIILQ